MKTAARYEDFATNEARGRSPLYERLARGIARDAQILELLERVPEPKRQPNLFFASARYLGWSGEDIDSFRTFVLARAAPMLALLAGRMTQTNEVGRCSVLLPVLSTIEGPIALLEVGASAGLCLLLDRFHYRYGTREIGDATSPVHLGCEIHGLGSLSLRIPWVTWRRGIDLAPIDVLDEEQVRWLEACVWADQPDRLARLRAAVALAREDPPRLIRGNLAEMTSVVASVAPPDSTLVVTHSATLAYVTPSDRQSFVDMMRALGCVWISNEGPRVVPGLEGSILSEAERRGAFVLAEGSRIHGLADPHGSWLELSSDR